MVTVLQYKLYLGEGKKMLYRAKLAEPSITFSTEPKYNLYSKTVTLYFVYPVTNKNLIKYFLYMFFN
jgi:hypothetical protein